jgi:hypothetical protein
MARPSSAAGFGGADGERPQQKPPSAPSSRPIPDHVARRMIRRIAVTTGLPSLLGMAVFVASYLLVSRGLADIPPVVTLLASGACFLLGLVGLSYGVLSCSWEERPGSLVGFEQFVINVGRLRQSLGAAQR